jgi:hypothetical protein
MSALFAVLHPLAGEIFSSDQGSQGFRRRRGSATPHNDNPQANAELAEKARLHYRINSKNRSSQVSSLMSMNLLQISVTMLITPW